MRTSAPQPGLERHQRHPEGSPRTLADPSTRHAFARCGHGGQDLLWIRAADAEEERRAYQNLLVSNSNSVGGPRSLSGVVTPLAKSIRLPAASPLSMCHLLSDGFVTLGHCVPRMSADPRGDQTIISALAGNSIVQRNPSSPKAASTLPSNSNVKRSRITSLP